MQSDKDVTLDSLTTMLAHLQNQPIRADANYDEMEPLEKIEHTINECIMLLSGSLHSGELDADILKIVLAKMQLSKTAIKEYGEGKEEVYDPLFDLSAFKLPRTYSSKYENQFIIDDPIDSIGSSLDSAIGKIRIKPKK